MRLDEIDTATAVLFAGWASVNVPTVHHREKVVGRLERWRLRGRVVRLRRGDRRWLLGIGVAELIDVTLLARERAPTSAPVHAAQHSHGVEVSPVVRAGRAGLGLVGRF